MPTYSYTNRRGRTIEKFFSLGKAPRTVKVGRSTFVRDVAADHRLFVNTPSTTGEFDAGDALAVHPDDVAAANALIVKKGLAGKAYHKKDGSLILSSHRGAYRDYCLAYGFHHNNAGYSEPSRDDVKRYRERRGEAPPQ